MTVVPPYLIEALERHPSARVRRAAERTRATVIRRERLPVAPAERAAPRPHPRRRLVYDSEHTRALPGRLVRSEGERRCGDQDADRAYDMAGQTLEFYAAVFERDSIDDRGMHVISSVHFGQRYQNASWDGAQMIYGDGDGEVFNSFTSCLDVAAHELAHGIVQADAGIVYEGEAGALCESIADVFGSLVKQWVLRQSAAEADWVVGAGIYRPGINGVGLRSLAAPGSAYDDPVLGGRDPQPSHMRDFVESGAGSNVVHLNSGIPNHAFYRFAHAVGGSAWRTAGHVWYEAVRSGLHRDCGFRAFATATVEAARSHGEHAVEAVRGAWHDVGITVRAASYRS